jgi:hypothetical protein
MTQSTSPQAHTGLQTFGRVIGFFLLSFFILLVPIYTILFGVSRTLLSEKYLETYLTDGVVRDRIISIAQTQLSSAASHSDVDGNGNLKSDSPVANSSAVTTLLEKAVSESTFNTVINTGLTNVFAFLKGDVKLADISISTTDLQKNVLSGLQSGVTTLPVCGPNEVFILNQGDGNSHNGDDNVALCRPAGVSDSELTKFAKNPEFTKMITDNIPATFKFTDLPNFDDINYQATQVQHYYYELTLGIIYGGLALVLALILGAFLWHQHLWYGLQTLGITLFIPLGGIYAVMLFGHIFTDRLVANNALSQDPTGIYAIGIGWHLVAPMLAYISNLAGMIALFGLVVFVIMEIIRHHEAKQKNIPLKASKAPKQAKKRVA